MQYKLNYNSFYFFVYLFNEIMYYIRNIIVKHNNLHDMYKVAYILQNINNSSRKNKLFIIQTFISPFF